MTEQKAEQSLLTEAMNIPMSLQRRDDSMNLLLSEDVFHRGMFINPQSENRNRGFEESALVTLQWLTLLSGWQGTRRDVIKLAGIALLASACGGLRSPEESGRTEEVIQESELTPIEGGTVRIQPKEIRIPNSPKWFPDTRTSWIKRGDKFLVFASAGVDSVRLEGNSLTELGEAKVVLGPDEKQTEYGFNGYRGFSTVFPGSKKELIAISHRELWPDQGVHFPFTAEIDLAISKDDGFSWEKKGTILRGDQVLKDADTVQGVGQPGAIVTQDGEVVVYHTNWGVGHATVCVAKAPLHDVANPEAWKKWDGTGFNAPGLGGIPEPVVVAQQGYSALPCISWNTKLKKLLMITEQDEGFYSQTSDNYIHWSEPQLFARFTQKHSRRQVENTWYSYPTLISPDTGDQFVTSGRGFLFVSRGTWNVNAHRGVLIPVEIG
ncbi:MAG: hypothetical protein A2785_00820 [Candidatus Chisholmbacteria bacterium RIFCSPHIGHO2_01_FULL_49_18]|uniref:Glycosyl hydrolase n=2 Tax=Candidatus Chisholmiibacteriota TaxID=1817900 RepID=A0A1G1VL86_9BACT|nr:MAG: hypothetical protein A2785_00820 [Candidatus Chisholmbacteria bacterium RIFCSPHIGHO2_01_FULL_49_18]OGY22212.1 MAG: hypothetical protein A3A65_04950 [Candidatus Chisholmbacteria bacterium RIFCSPLOWO2_01_FULL_49_14]